METNPQEQVFTENTNTPGDPLPESPSRKLPKNIVIIIVVAVCISLLVTTYLLFGKTTISSLNKTPYSTPGAHSESISTTPQPTPATINSAKLSPTPTKKQNSSTTPTSTQKPTAVTPTIKPTGTPTPTVTLTPTPTRTPNPPQVSISFPTEGEMIYASNNTDNRICVADSPNGGDLSGVTRRHYENTADWTAYVPISGVCFTPIQGQNTIGMQYKNQYGDESQPVIRHFTYDYNN